MNASTTTDTSFDEIWFERGGARLFAVARGDGPPIVLLHGGLANHLACWQFAGPLTARYRVVTPDLRGAGRSTYAGTLTWDDLADDVHALLRHLHIDRAVIGGVSFGAAAAVRFALRHPTATAALAVLTPAYGGADLGMTAAQIDAMDAMHAAGARCLTDGVRALYPLFDPLPPDIRTRALAMVDGFDPASVETTTRFMASRIQPFASPADLAALTMPTLVVPGADPTHPPDVADAFARGIPKCTVRDAAPHELAAIVADFVAPLF